MDELILLAENNGYFLIRYDTFSEVFTIEISSEDDLNGKTVIIPKDKGQFLVSFLQEHLKEQ